MFEEKLRKIGLTKYESSVYTTLIKIGLSTSTKVSRESDVPYGRIYTILSSLEKKGFIKIFEGKPKKFMAVEPRLILNEVLDEKIKEIEENKNEIKKLINELETMSKFKFESPKEAVNVIEGRKNYLNFAIKLHEKTKREWRSIHTLPIYKPHLEAYEKMIKRGIVTKILTQVTKDNIEKVRIWKKIGAKIRYTDVVDVRFTVIDKEEVVLRLSDPEIKGWIAIWIKSHALATSMANYFDNLWKKARPIKF